MCSTAEIDIYRNIENNGRWWGRGGGGKESGSHDGFKVQGPWLGGALRDTVEGGGRREKWGWTGVGVQKEHRKRGINKNITS